MRVYYRVGRNSGVSVGVIGGMILVIMLATLWFYLALFAAAVLALAVAWRGVTRVTAVTLVSLVLLLALVCVTVGVTPWGLVEQAWRTTFGTNQGI